MQADAFQVIIDYPSLGVNCKLSQSGLSNAFFQSSGQLKSILKGCSRHPFKVRYYSLKSRERIGRKRALWLRLCFCARRLFCPAARCIGLSHSVLSKSCR
ncbi:hypothetical protein PNK_1058 [Candidatus Protochlamydia naegleriophila]|uniref:Uncharacterized protein n=1 Tax=Candidatus Protochlamydia naegleriophila TaxID=389348 RepID=A0A0U5ER81_9BACT|nr:hypothetical protein PNK_1058 [Candidatus Protochlamydia naegleriophila]